MTEVSQEIREQIKQSAKDGDLKRLKALANQFPESFTGFSNAPPKDNLVDLAWNRKKHDVLIWLVVEKGLEASERLSTNRGEIDYNFDDPEERYHKTAEVLVAAIFNKDKTSGGDCRSVMYWAEREIPDIVALRRQSVSGVNPQFIQQTQSGNFRKFVARMASDSRVENIGTAHSAEMFKALHANINQIEQELKGVQIEINEWAKPDAGRSPS